MEEIQTRATIIKTYDERRVVIPNADLFTHSVIVNTALGSRRWEYDLSVQSVDRLDELKSLIIKAVHAVPGVLPDPGPEALVVDLNVPSSDTVKMRVLWWTNDSRQHQMLASYDRVLPAIMEAFHRSRGEKQARAA